LLDERDTSWKPRGDRYASYWPHTLINIETNGIISYDYSGRSLDEIEEFVGSKL
jgi:hypothetical protein